MAAVWQDTHWGNPGEPHEPKQAFTEPVNMHIGHFRDGKCLCGGYFANITGESKNFFRDISDYDSVTKQ